jgi:hypothetical protein
MKTDDLINLLGTNLEPVRSGQLRYTLLVALAVGAAAALCVMLLVFGAPNEAFDAEYFVLRLVGLAFTLGLVTAGASFLFRAARPGTPGHKPLVVIGLVLVGLVSAGAITLVLSHPATWREMILGPQWMACVLCIPLFAIVPFAALIWALRKNAPTSPASTGAVAGLVAGALGAAAYTLHQPVSSVPFIVVWYVGPILLSAFVGWMLGPRLLRW